MFLSSKIVITYLYGTPLTFVALIIQVQIHTLSFKLLNLNCIPYNIISIMVCCDADPVNEFKVRGEPIHAGPTSPRVFRSTRRPILAAEENLGTTWRAAARTQDRATAYARGSSDQSPSVVHF